MRAVWKTAARLALALLIVTGAALAGPGGSASAGPVSGCEITPSSAPSSPFAGVCDYLDLREGVFQIALYDKVQDETWLLRTGDDIQYTASIAKVDVLARWLNQYQRRGMKIPGQIPYSIRYLFGRMIQNSDNAATTGLFYFGGGCRSLTRFNLMIPMNETRVGCESDNYYGWGNTQTSAADQVRLMKVYAYGSKPAIAPHGANRTRKASIRNCRKIKRTSRRKACVRRAKRKFRKVQKQPILGQDARNYGTGLMQGVEPDQRFGVTCGPWGGTCDPPNWATPDPEVTVSLKNGWKTLPTCTDPIPQCPWQVNSNGWIKGKGRDYVISVLTTKDPVGSGDTYGFNYGIETIQGISKLVWSNLAP